MTRPLDGSVHELLSMLPEEGGSGHLTVENDGEVLAIVIFARGADAKTISELYHNWNDTEEAT